MKDDIFYRVKHACIAGVEYKTKWFLVDINNGFYRVSYHRSRGSEEWPLSNWRPVAYGKVGHVPFMFIPPLNWDPQDFTEHRENIKKNWKKPEGKNDIYVHPIFFSDSNPRKHCNSARYSSAFCRTLMSLYDRMTCGWVCKKYALLGHGRTRYMNSKETTIKSYRFDDRVSYILPVWSHFLSNNIMTDAVNKINAYGYYDGILKVNDVAQVSYTYSSANLHKLTDLIPISMTGLPMPASFKDLFIFDDTYGQTDTHKTYLQKHPFKGKELMKRLREAHSISLSIGYWEFFHYVHQDSYGDKECQVNVSAIGRRHLTSGQIGSIFLNANNNKSMKYIIPKNWKMDGLSDKEKLFMNNVRISCVQLRVVADAIKALTEAINNKPYIIDDLSWNSTKHNATQGDKYELFEISISSIKDQGKRYILSFNADADDIKVNITGEVVHYSPKNIAKIVEDIDSECIDDEIDEI